MEYVIGFVIGVLIYHIMKALFLKVKTIGTLRVDRSDPTDNPYLFLELDAGTNVNTIIRSKYATFRVKVKNFLPHE